MGKLQLIIISNDFFDLNKRIADRRWQDKLLLIIRFGSILRETLHQIEKGMYIFLELPRPPPPLGVTYMIRRKNENLDIKRQIFFVYFNSFYPKIYLFSEMQRKDLERNKLSLNFKVFWQKNANVWFLVLVFWTKIGRSSLSVEQVLLEIQSSTVYLNGQFTLFKCHSP